MSNIRSTGRRRKGSCSVLLEASFLLLLESKVFTGKEVSTYQNGGMFQLQAVETAKFIDALRVLQSNSILLQGVPSS